MNPLRMFLLAALILAIPFLSEEAEAHSGDIFTMIISKNGIAPTNANIMISDTARFINVDDTENLTHRILVDADSDGKYNGEGDLDSGDLTNSCETDGNGTKLDENCNAFFDIFFDESFLGKSNNDIVGTYAFVDLASNGVKSFGNLTVEFDCHGTIAAFNWSYTNDTGGIVMGVAVEGLPTHFNAGGSEDNSNCPLTYFWDFGDGTNGTGITVNHAFNEVTVFNVVLTVTDSSGNQDQISYGIQPALMNRPDLYVSTLTFSNETPQGGEEITINASIKLLGMEIAGDFEVEFFSDGESIGSVTVNSADISLGLENEYIASINWVAVSGVHTIYVVADSTDVVDENIEKNGISVVITIAAICYNGDNRTADDGCNQCICNNEEWVCTEVACNPDDKDEGESSLPSVSMIPALISIGLIARYRRK